MAAAVTSAEIRIGGWSLRQFGHLTRFPSFVAGLIGIVLILLGFRPAYLWTLLLLLYVLLAFRVLRRGGKEIHLATAGWLTGVPLGLALGAAQVIHLRTAISVLELVRQPILVSLFGILVASATGFTRTRRLTTRHLILGDDHSSKRNQT